MNRNAIISARLCIEYLNTVLLDPQLRCHVGEDGIMISLVHKENGQTYAVHTVFDGTENKAIVLSRSMKLVRSLMALYTETEAMNRLYAAL